MFDDHPLPAKVLPVQLVDSVVGVAVVFKFHEPIPGKGGGKKKQYDHKLRKSDDKVFNPARNLVEFAMRS